jgi:AAA+ ATPase superfamily predicted ATPase
MKFDLTPKFIEPNEQFKGRLYERNFLSGIMAREEASIITVYGRRRVGKTELLEQTFRERNILKFEGTEGAEQEVQIQGVLNQFAEYAQSAQVAKLQFATWTEVLGLIADSVAVGKWTIYFEELQWLAAYEERFVAELKMVWDNKFRYNKNLIIILCGSSPSFMINKVLQSKALYNRAQHELHVKEFTPHETLRYFAGKRSPREVMDAYLTVGGIPEYLKYINSESSILLGIYKNSFIPDGFFVNERKRVFVSSLAKNENYEKIVEFLSKHRSASRDAILKHLKTTSGGTLSALLSDLEQCGFINKIKPFNVNDRSTLVRYIIADPYLHFYYKFIKPKVEQIKNGNFRFRPEQGMQSDSYYKWLGFAFERMCRRYNILIARILGFEAVEYNSGVYFNRASAASAETGTVGKSEGAGVQFDLIFERADRVYTICEIKYQKSAVAKKVIDEFEQKLSIFPNKKHYTIHKVLIASDGVEASLKDSRYFDRILTINELLAAHGEY